ncbi:MAG: hypothetical protein NTY38_17725 [Acidobacteria bacterium]|nr:hypothetical protein [Acidobacteriota bacterium]
MRITFNKLNRRIHLYLGLVLTPWFLIYAGSSVILSHRAWFETPDDKRPEWTKRFEHAYRLPPITDDSDEYALAEKMLHDHGLTGRYRSYFDDDNNLVVSRTRLISTIRLTYFPAQSRILAEDKRISFRDSLTAAHFRAGFAYPYWTEIAWAVVIDLVVAGTLLWIATGLYLWFKLKQLRFWGWVSIGAGCASFVAIILLM